MLGGGLIIRFIGTNIDRYTVENLERNVYVLQRVNSLRVLVAVVPVIIAYFIYGLRGLNENEDRAFSFNILLLNAVLAIGTSGSAYLARFALYTNIFIPIVFPRLFVCIDNKKKTLLKLINILAVILYIGFWIYEISVNDDLYNWRWITENTDYDFSYLNWFTDIFAQEKL